MDPSKYSKCTTTLNSILTNPTTYYANLCTMCRNLSNYGVDHKAVKYFLYLVLCCNFSLHLNQISVYIRCRRDYICHAPIISDHSYFKISTISGHDIVSVLLRKYNRSKQQDNSFNPTQINL